MDWNVISAASQLVAAVAVVISLGYLGRQIQQNTKAVRAATADTVVASMRDWIRPLIDDPSAARVFQRGVEGDWTDLDESETARLHDIMFVWLKTFENFHYQYAQGMLYEEVWRGWSNILSAYLVAPGVRRFWSMRQDAFSVGFQRYVTASMSSPVSMRRGAELLQGSPGHGSTTAP